MPVLIRNGRRCNVPQSGISGKNLINTLYPHKKSGRRATMIKGSNAELVDPNKNYKPSDLIDKRGRAVKLGDMPDRTKGNWIKSLFNNYLKPQNSYQTTNTPSSRPATNEDALFWGNRSKLSKRIILEQCEDIARLRFGNDVQIDNEGADTFVVNSYALPTKWRNVPGVVNNRTQLAIVFPTKYPKIAPIGFYLKAEIDNAPNGHFYNAAYHNADKLMLDYGWKWYCVYVNEGCWQPAYYRKPNDWRAGDNLWTYFDLIKEALTSND